MKSRGPGDCASQVAALRESITQPQQRTMPRPQIVILCVSHAFGKDIHCSVFVPVQHGVAGGAFPTTNIQRQLLDDVATMEARLRVREEAIYLVEPTFIYEGVPGAVVGVVSDDDQCQEIIDDNCDWVDAVIQTLRNTRDLRIFRT